MADWKEIRTNAKKTANKAIKKTGEIADVASMHIRLKALEAKRDAQYKQLGKLTYRQMKTGESLVGQIAPVIEKLDELRDKIKALVAEIEAEKATRKAKKAEKAEKSEEPTEEPVADTDADTEEAAE